MPQIAAITIKDGKTPTALDHLFQPFTAGSSSSWKRIDVAGQPVIAQESITAVLKSPSQPKQAYKVELNLNIPVLEQTTGGTSSGYVAPPALAHTQRMQVILFCDPRSTVEQRRDLRVMGANLLNNAQVIELIENLVPPM